MDTIYFDDAPLPGYDHRVIVQEQIERKDASGETSASTGSHGGWKPAILTVTLKLRWEDKVGRFALKNLWTDRELDGTPAVRNITYPLLEPLHISEVRFTDFLRIAQAEKAKRWEVVFNLIEVRSVPERREERDAEPATEEPGAPDGLFTVTGEAAGAAPTTAETSLEKLLHRADSFLGKILFGEGGTG